MFDRMKNNKSVIFILFLFFFVSFIGIFHDLPYSYYPDEVHFVNRSVSFGDGDINPHWFSKPALYMYMLFIEYGIFFFIGKIIGFFKDTQEFAIFYFNNTGVFYFIGRLTSAFFGVAVIFLTFFLGKRAYEEKIGILASIFLLLTFAHYKSSIMIKADVPATFFTLLSYIFVFEIYNNGRKKYYILSGVFSGLGMATKYYSLGLLFPIFFCHFLRKSNDGLLHLKNFVSWNLLLAYMVFIISFFTGSPYNFIDPTWFNHFIYPRIESILSLGEVSQHSSVDIALSPYDYIYSIIKYFQVALSAQGMGTIIGILSIVGLAYIISKRDRKSLAIVSLPCFFILLANFANPFFSQPRHQVVIYPYLALCGAVFTVRLLETVSNIIPVWRERGYVKYFVVIASMILVIPAFNIVSDLYITLQKDPRTLAKEWIESNIPDGTKIVLDEYTPHIRMTLNNIKNLYERSLKEDDNGQFTAKLPDYYKYRMMAHSGISYDITEIRHPWWMDEYKKEEMSEARGKWDVNYANPVKPVGVMDLEYYISRGYSYVITNSKFDKYLKEEKMKKFPSFYKFYNELPYKGTLIKEFHHKFPHIYEDSIRIYKIGSKKSNLEAKSY